MEDIRTYRTHTYRMDEEDDAALVLDDERADLNSKDDEVPFHIPRD